MHRLLGQGQILIHPFVIAELALGSLRDRARTLALLELLPQAKLAQLSEVRRLIEGRALYLLGVAVVDAHLIASVLIDAPALLWTRDKRLRQVAENLSIHASLP